MTTTRRFIDVSRPLAPGIATWPGDREFEIHTQRWPNLTLSGISTSCHVGTHLEAPLHVNSEGSPVEAITLDRLVGEAEVVMVDGGCEAIGRSAIDADWTPAAARVLFSTGSHGLGDAIGPGYPGLEPGFASWLAERGVDLIGVDTPSVDPFDSKELPVHHELDRLGLAWIEGLWLESAPKGVNHMIALPMALVGVDAAPCRVVLEVSS